MERTLQQWQTDMTNGISITKADKKFKFLSKVKSLFSASTKEVTIETGETNYDWYAVFFRMIDDKVQLYLYISLRKDKDVMHRWKVSVSDMKEEFDTSTALLKYINW